MLFRSLWEEEEENEEPKDAGEIAGDTEISLRHPSAVAAEAAPELPQE